MLDLIEEYMILRGYKYRRLDGKMSLQFRGDSIQDFTSDPEIFVFLISTRAGGLGLNLVTADTVILFDRDWVRLACCLNILIYFYRYLFYRIHKWTVKLKTDAIE